MMVNVYGNVNIRVGKRDSEISEKISAMGFDVSSAIITGYTRRTDNCFYDNTKLKKMENVKDFPWRAYYICPRCNRRYVMDINGEEMKKLEEERRLKLLKIKRRERGLTRTR